jgi:hypothetical protein
MNPSETVMGRAGFSWLYLVGGSCEHGTEPMVSAYGGKFI